VTVAVLAQSRLFGLMPVKVAFQCVINGLFTLAKFVAKQLAILCHCLTSLGHLGRHDTDRIVSIFVATPKVAKASTSVSLLRVTLSLALLC
jgi:hypothetical protein